MTSQLLTQINLGNITGIGNLGIQTTGFGHTFTIFENLISVIVGLFTVIAGIYFLFQLMISAINWMSAGGDKQRHETAQKRIQNAIIGLILIVASYALAGIVGRVLGFNLLQPAMILFNLTP